MRILLVDDDTRFAEDCVRTLLRNRYAAAFAPDPISARRKMAESHFDMIIIDLMLPPSFGVEGVDLLKFIKLNDRSTPVIMITSRAQKTTNIVAEAMKVGASEFIDKDDACFADRLLTAISETAAQSPIPTPPNRPHRPILVYVIAFIAVASFCVLLAYLLRDIGLPHLIVLAAFLFLCLTVLVFIVASHLLETGKLSSQQWYKMTAEKVLSGPLGLIRTLSRRKSEKG